MLDLDSLIIGPCMQSFGESITFMPSAAPSATLTAVFTERAAETKFAGGDEIVEEKTMLGAQESQFNGNLPVVNDQVLVRGRLYRITEILPDGHGHVRLNIVLAGNDQENIPEIPPVITPA